MEEEKTISYFKGKIEEKVDVQHIRNKLAQFLQMDNLNFLIGAGCSSHLVDNNEDICCLLFLHRLLSQRLIDYTH